MLRALSVLVAFLTISLASGCDSGDVETSFLGFSPDLPLVIVAGEPTSVTAIGRNNRRPYDGAKVLVFRDQPRFTSDGLVGDTLFAQRLDIAPGAFEFSEDVVITIPADAITRPGTLWAYVAVVGEASGGTLPVVPAP